LQLKSELQGRKSGLIRAGALWAASLPS